MLAVTSRLWFAALGLVTGACALAGYDFGDYERAPVTTSAGGADTPGSGISLTATPFASGGDDASSTAGHGAGGDETSGGAGAPGASGASGASGAFGEAPTPVCVPRGCFELGLACGPADDGCGRPLDCGPCFWWFQECVENRCEIPE